MKSLNCLNCGKFASKSSPNSEIFFSCNNPDCYRSNDFQISLSNNEISGYSISSQIDNKHYCLYADKNLLFPEITPYTELQLFDGTSLVSISKFIPINFPPSKSEINSIIERLLNLSSFQ